MSNQNFRGGDKTLSAVFIALSLMFIFLIHGAIPFVSMPTLGQAIWLTGFSQSFANESIFSVYATNFGNPEPAAISFGLAGAYPISLFIRMGLHHSDAYSLMIAVWLSVAYFGTWKIAKALQLSALFSTLVSVLWLSMPIVWGHSGYSMLSMGIALLPFYFWASLKLFSCFGISRKVSIRVAGFYLLATIISIFMDGYTFMMFAVGSSIVGVFMFIFIPESRRKLLIFSFPVHVFSFVLAYFIYVSYVGQSQFSSAPLSFFRGWGVDLMYLLVPSKDIHWFWDYLGLSFPRSGHEQFGDASVWNTTFAFPLIIVGIFSWWVVRKHIKLATGFLLVSIFGFYMGLGPSIKFNSVKPNGVTTPVMAQEYAISPTGNGWLSENLPGFKSMRAAYRWSALGFLGLWLLVVVMISREQTCRYQWRIVFTLLLLILSNLPHIERKLENTIDFRSDFMDIDSSIVVDLERQLDAGELVAFLPYRNDFFVNYLSSITNTYSYNVGGDKNLVSARNYWPETMRQFKMGQVDEGFTTRILLLLARGQVDAVVLPYIDLLWAAHIWPAPLKFKGEVNLVVEELRQTDFVEIEESEFYTIIRLAMKYRNPVQLEILMNQMTQKYQSY